MTKRISTPIIERLKEIYTDLPDAAKVEVEDLKHGIKYSITREKGSGLDKNKKSGTIPLV